MDIHHDRRRTAASDSAPLRLLVVDDDADYLAYIVALTRRLGFHVDTAGDGQAALDLLAREVYDAAIIDQEMPRMTGIEAIARLRANDQTKTLYVLMLSGREDMATKLTALEAGFDDFLTKTASEAEIVAKLTAARRLAARQRTMDTTIRKLYGLATRDELTGVFNRRFYVAETEQLLAAGVAVNVLLFDLDDFKEINDTYGHLAGDLVLRDVGAMFHRTTRPEDIVARLGGDEFVISVPHVDVPTVQRMLARLSAELQSLEWSVGEERFKVGVSTGMASSTLLADPTLAQLFNAADRDLYKNKWVRKHPDLRPELYVYPANGRGTDRLWPTSDEPSRRVGDEETTAPDLQQTLRAKPPT